MNLIDLPDLCLIAILDRLPVRDLFHICLVCTKFHKAQKAVLLRKQTLRLFGDCEIYVQTFYGDPGYRFYGIPDRDSFDLVLKYTYDPELYPLELRQFPGLPHPDIATLKHDWLVTEASIRYGWSSSNFVNNNLVILFPHRDLGRTFPNIKHLTIVTTNCWINSYVAKLIRLWPEVISLTLLNHIHHGFQFGELRDSINQLKKLQRLSTDMSIEQLADLRPRIDQLRELTTQVSCCVRINSRIPNSSNNNHSLQCYYAKELPEFLTQLNFHKFERFGLKVAEIYKVDRLVLSNFFRSPFNNLTHASLTLQNVNHLGHLSTAWTSLCYLQLTLEPNLHKVYPKIEEVLTPLATLPKLSHLYLSLSTEHDPKLKLSNRVRRKLPRLESIRVVHFNMVVDPHDIR